MIFFKRYSYFFLICLYILILISPAFYFSAKGALRALYPILILLGLLNLLPLRRPWRWLLFVTGLFFVLVPSAHFFALTFRAPLNETLWIITQGTNIIESKDYLKSNALWPIASIFFLCAVWFFYYKTFNHWTYKLNKKLSVFLLLFLIIPITHIIKNPRQLLKEFNHHFTESYPFNVIFSYVSAQKNLQDYTHYKMTAVEQIEITKNNPSPRTFVLVIGESATRNRLQLYGAPAANNPYLQLIENELFLFKDVITLHPHTMASLPVILTQNKGLTNDNPEELEQQTAFAYSFIQVLKKAGYKTFWISNQASLGGSSSQTGFYARSTDYQKFFHIYDANNPTMYDEAVLNDFQKQLNDPAPLKFFVLHLQGSHYNFKSRVPLKFQKLADDYDNTLLYTDWLLSEVIGELKKMALPTGLLYLSDHGLLLNACGKAYTHYDNKEAFEIPFFFWLSDSWKKENSEKVSFLKDNMNKKWTTQYVFDSLLDLAGVDYRRSGAKLSLFDQIDSLQNRKVKTYSQIVNYDTGVNDSACHLVSP